MIMWLFSRSHHERILQQPRPRFLDENYVTILFSKYRIDMYLCYLCAQLPYSCHLRAQLSYIYVTCALNCHIFMLPARAIAIYLCYLRVQLPYIYFMPKQFIFTEHCVQYKNFAFVIYKSLCYCHL